MSKRQRLSSNQYTQVIPPIAYEAPQESLVNFPSSIVNGVTKEKGIVSLTLKSVTSAKLVEEISWMNDVVLNKEIELLRVTEKDFPLTQTIESLQAEVAALKKDAAERGASAPEGAHGGGRGVVESLTTKLEASLDHKNDGRALMQDVLAAYSTDHPLATLTLTEGKPKRVDVKFDIQVDRRSDVQRADEIGKLVGDEKLPADEEEGEEHDAGAETEPEVDADDADPSSNTGAAVQEAVIATKPPAVPVTSSQVASSQVVDQQTEQVPSAPASAPANPEHTA